MIGRCARVVRLPLTRGEALVRARAVVEILSGKTSKTYDDRVVMAWPGSRWSTNIPKWARYQYVAAVGTETEAWTEVLCAVRPGFRGNLFCLDRADRLRDELTAAMASGPGLPDPDSTLLRGRKRAHR